MFQINCNDGRHLFNGKRLSACSRFQAGSGAFTLTEMLVVVAVISVLALLSFTAYQKSMAVSRQSVCSSNMRQVYQAILFYANDNEGILIPCLQYMTPDSGNTWEGYLLSGGYIPSGPDLLSLACPGPYDIAKSPNSYTGYGMNCYLSPVIDSIPQPPGQPPLPVKYVHIRDIHNPSQRFLLIDYGEYATWPWGPPPAINYRHSGGANLCFLDGHVEWWKSPIVNPPAGPPYTYPW